MRTIPRTICPSEGRGHMALYGKAARCTGMSQFSLGSSEFVSQTPEALGLNSSFTTYCLYGQGESQISHLVALCTTNTVRPCRALLGTKWDKMNDLNRPETEVKIYIVFIFHSKTFKNHYFTNIKIHMASVGSSKTSALHSWLPVLADLGSGV